MPIYLDNHAATPVDPRVAEAMVRYMTERFGNASSKSHSFGWDAQAAVENARGQVASTIDSALTRTKWCVPSATTLEQKDAREWIDASRRER